MIVLYFQLSNIPRIVDLMKVKINKMNRKSNNKSIYLNVKHNVAEVNSYTYDLLIMYATLLGWF